MARSKRASYSNSALHVRSSEPLSPREQELWKMQWYILCELWSRKQSMLVSGKLVAFGKKGKAQSVRYSVARAHVPGAAALRGVEDIDDAPNLVSRVMSLWQSMLSRLMLLKSALVFVTSIVWWTRPSRRELRVVAPRFGQPQAIVVGFRNKEVIILSPRGLFKKG